MEKSEEEKWIKDTALLFYQVFSVEYAVEKFKSKLLQGGGGNSTLCSTWVQLSECFVRNRISKKAYELLINIITEPDRQLIIKQGNFVFIPSSFRKKKYSYLFSSNAKGAENRKQKGQYFHFDHNPSNKKVLVLLKEKVKNIKGKEDFLDTLSSYIKNIQTEDLITVEEDDIRTSADLNSLEKLGASDRDKISSSEFYNLVFTKN